MNFDLGLLPMLVRHVNSEAVFLALDKGPTTNVYKVETLSHRMAGMGQLKF